VPSKIAASGRSRSQPAGGWLSSSAGPSSAFTLPCARSASLNAGEPAACAGFSAGGARRRNVRPPSCTGTWSVPVFFSPEITFSDQPTHHSTRAIAHLRRRPAGTGLGGRSHARASDCLHVRGVRVRGLVLRSVRAALKPEELQSAELCTTLATAASSLACMLPLPSHSEAQAFRSEEPTGALPVPSDGALPVPSAGSLARAVAGARAASMANRYLCDRPRMRAGARAWCASACAHDDAVCTWNASACAGSPWSMHAKRRTLAMFRAPCSACSAPARGTLWVSFKGRNPRLMIRSRRKIPFTCCNHAEGMRLGWVCLCGLCVHAD
jgi:hypothetical protein